MGKERADRLAHLDVLVVDGDVHDAKLASALLAATGRIEFSAAQASNLAQAIERLRSSHWDAVVVDLRLPDSTGLETVERIHDAVPDTPVVVLTDQYDEDEAQDMGIRILEAGAQDYIPKQNLDGDRLRRAVAYACMRKELGRATHRAERNRRDQAQEIVQSERIDVYRKDLINRTAHALGTPMTPIQLQVHRLRDHPDSLVKDAASTIARNLDRLGRAVDEVMQAADFGAAVPLRLRTVSVRALCQDALKEYADVARARGVHLAAHLDGAPVMADPDRLAQVVTHLIDNAIRFTPPGGHVTVVARDKMRNVVVEVRDDGKGLTSEEVRAIFSGGEGTPVATGGIGLGLQLAERIVEAHKGDLWCSSLGPGQGTTFAFTVPRVEGSGATVRSGAQEEQETAATAPGHGSGPSPGEPGRRADRSTRVPAPSGARRPGSRRPRP